ncbi:MAG: aminotransferase class V-fold PLP-dependent enzyme, partial [Thiotrichales bacterium]
MNTLIYLDYNATTPIDPRVLDALLPWLRDGYGNPSSDHPPGRHARAAIEHARAQVAALIGARSDEIYFTASA